MNHKSIAATILAAITIPVAVVWATPAQAAPKPAPVARLASLASTTTGRCWVSPDQLARLSVTRYAVSGGIEYHMDLNSSTGALTPKYFQLSITFDGATVTGTNDVYRKVSGGTHSITGHWSGVTSSCTVRL